MPVYRGGLGGLKKLQIGYKLLRNKKRGFRPLRLSCRPPSKAPGIRDNPSGPHLYTAATGLRAVEVIGKVAHSAVSRSHGLSRVAPSTFRCLRLCHTVPSPLGAFPLGPLATSAGSRPCICIAPTLVAATSFDRRLPSGYGVWLTPVPDLGLPTYIPRAVGAGPALLRRGWRALLFARAVVMLSRARGYRRGRLRGDKSTPADKDIIPQDSGFVNTFFQSAKLFSLGPAPTWRRGRWPCRPRRASTLRPQRPRRRGFRGLP